MRNFPILSIEALEPAATDQTKEKATPSQGRAVSTRGGAANAAKLQKTDSKVGTGKAAKTGDNITVHYRGTLFRQMQPLFLSLSC